MARIQKSRFLRDRLAQLNRLGLVMPPEHHELRPTVSAISVEQAANEYECPIMDLPDGRTLYVIWLSLVAAAPGTRLDSYRVEPPWPDPNFESLPSFKGSHIGEYYKLPGGLEYPRQDILNFNFVKPGWRLPGNRVEGVLCAISGTAIPDEFKHGASIPVTVRFFNRTGQQLAATTANLWADRPAHLPQRAKALSGKVRDVKPKYASNPPASSAAALPKRPVPRSPRPANDLWTESVPSGKGPPTKTRVRTHVPRSFGHEEHDETRRRHP
jgi:hypothetical protein